MRKNDPAVVRETLYIAVTTLIFSTVMQLVFLLLRAWNITVLFGNLLSGTAVVFNFYLMARSVQSSLQREKKAASDFMRLSQTLRFLLLVCVTALGVCIPQAFNMWAVLIPLLFVRLAVALRPLAGRIIAALRIEDTDTEVKGE